MNTNILNKLEPEQIKIGRAEFFILVLLFHGKLL